MPHSLRIAYLPHSIRSDWNNGNAHFLRGLLRALGQLGHDVTIFEPEEEWSVCNLRMEEQGERARQQFTAAYPDLQISLYDPSSIDDQNTWTSALRDCDIVILHEWNPPSLARTLLAIRSQLKFKLLFHDTHHRVSSAPDQIRQFELQQFDGVLAFGESLRKIYHHELGITQVWTLHEAADTTVFHPIHHSGKEQDVIWIGNWGEGERSREIAEFFLYPAQELPQYDFTVYGVRYPEEGKTALREAGVSYRGYLPNLQAPCAYAASRLTLHIPRQQYAVRMSGVPTIRVFEAMACGIPLLSAPWEDSEGLFPPEALRFARNKIEMKMAIEHLLTHPEEAEALGACGRAAVLARHTCMHRAEQLTSLCEVLLT